MPTIHPAIVHFPIALTVTSVASDTAGVIFQAGGLSDVGRWTIALAVAGGALAIPAGYRDMRRDALRPGTHDLVHLHKHIGWTIATTLVVLGIWRWAGGMPGVVYLVVGWLGVALVLLQAWLGGEIVYAHGAGVAAASQGLKPPEQAQRPSNRFYRLIMRRYPKSDRAGEG